MNLLLKRLKMIVAEEEHDDEQEEVVCENLDDVKQYVEDIDGYACSPYDFSEDGMKDNIKDWFPIQENKLYDGGADELVEKLEEYTFDDYCTDILNSERLQDSYKNSWNSYVTDADLDYDVESFDWDSIASDLWEVASEDDELEKIYDSVMDEYIAKIPNWDEKERIEDNGNSKKITLDEIVESDDKVGDVFKVDDMDYETRDTAFIYIDGEIIESYNGESHSQLLQRYLEENEKTVPQDLYDRDQYKGSRPSVKQTKRMTGAEDVAFGHIKDDCAFIEVISGGATLDDVANACKKDYSKVYQYDGERIKRVASSKNMENVIRSFGFRPFVVENLGTALMGKYSMITMEEGYPRIDVALSSDVEDFDQEKFDDEFVKALMLCKTLGKLQLYTKK